MVINPAPLDIPSDAGPNLRQYIEYLNTLLRQISQALGPNGVIGVAMAAPTLLLTPSAICW